MDAEMRRVKENICDFLLEVGGEHVDHRNIEPVYMAAVAIEKIMKTEVLEEEMGGYSREGGYSERRRYSRDGGMSNRGYSRDGDGYDEGGDSYRRDSRGRYSRDDGKEKLREQAEKLMHQAGSPQEKDTARKFMEMLERM